MRACAGFGGFLLLFSLALSAQPNTETLLPWQLAVTTGFASVAAGKDSLLADNRGAELGLVATLPWRFMNERASLVTLRAQTIAFPTAIETPSPAVAGETVKLTNASHSQLRLDARQIYELWGIHWALGLGVMVPVTSSITTPRGEYTFAEAGAIYTAAQGDLRKIDKSYAVYLRFGIDQKMLDDALLLGLGIDIHALEFPRTEQRVALNFYAGVRVW